MIDLGVKLVKEFARTFGAYIGLRPEVREFGNETHGALSSYHAAAAELGERLKVYAQEAADRGDEYGSLLLIRLQLIQEELAELSEAMINRDIVECFDALVDLSYVVDGTYISLGLDELKLDGIREVHRSNMSKLGEDGKPIISSAGRVVKGPNYTPPKLRTIIEGKL